MNRFGLCISHRCLLVYIAAGFLYLLVHASAAKAAESRLPPVQREEFLLNARIVTLTSLREPKDRERCDQDLLD